MTALSIVDHVQAKKRRLPRYRNKSVPILENDIKDEENSSFDGEIKQMASWEVRDHQKKLGRLGQKLRHGKGGKKAVTFLNSLQDIGGLINDK